MAYITGTDNFYLYLTKRMRDYIGTGNLSKAIFDRIAVSDDDINYSVYGSFPITANNMPDITGFVGNAIENAASNFRLRNYLYLEDEGTAIYSTIMRNQNTPFGFLPYRNKSSLLNYDNNPSGDYTISIIDSSAPSIKNNLLSTFNLPITATQKSQFDNKYANTGLSKLNQSKYLVVELPKSLYQEQIIGNTIKLEIPKTGAGNWVIYGKYYKNDSITEPQSKLYSDPNTFSQDFGGELSISDPYNTSIAYLFCDDIDTPISGTTWATEESAIYSDNRQQPVCSTGTTLYVDRCIGIAYLDKGFMVIAEPDIVDTTPLTTKYYIDSAFVGLNTLGNTRDLYTNQGYVEFRTIKTQYIQSLNHILASGEYNRTSNGTYVGGNLYITAIGIYNSSNELLAIAKPKTPILKVLNTTDIPLSIKVYL